MKLLKNILIFTIIFIVIFISKGCCNDKNYKVEITYYNGDKEILILKRETTKLKNSCLFDDNHISQNVCGVRRFKILK